MTGPGPIGAVRFDAESPGMAVAEEFGPGDELFVGTKPAAAKRPEDREKPSVGLDLEERLAAKTAEGEAESAPELDERGIYEPLSPPLLLPLSLIVKLAQAILVLFA